MDTAAEMLKSSPNQSMADQNALLACLAACADCAGACLACADACLGEEEVEQLRKCIRLNLDCGDICQTTGRLLSRQLAPDQEIIRQQMTVTALSARLCAEECARHAQHHEHCRICAEACRRCQQACEALARGLRVH